MGLRAKPPSHVVKRLKMFMYGPAGVGKTTAAIQFPKVYLIDTEHGAENDQYVKALERVGGVHFFTTDLEEIISEVMALATEKHDFRTLVIDPVTIPYNDACDKAARELADEKKGLDGTEFGRHKAKADRLMKRLAKLLLTLDMNVLATSHAKTKWSKQGDTFKEEGQTFDCYSKMDYLFDLVVEVQKRGKERVGDVRKTRIEAFPEGDIFPFTYDTIAERYGRAILEKESEPIVLASAEQAAKIRHLVGVLKIDEELIEAWMDKAQAESWEQFPAEAADKVIVYMEDKINNPKPATAAA